MKMKHSDSSQDHNHDHDHVNNNGNKFPKKKQRYLVLEDARLSRMRAMPEYGIASPKAMSDSVRTAARA